MGGEVKEIVDTAIASVAPHDLGDGRFVVVHPEQGVEIIDPISDALRDAPRRVTGLSRVTDVESFKFLWDKHASSTSELFADDTTFAITGILNADRGTDADAGFRDHRVVFQSVLTLAWQTWIGLDGKMLDQHTFAEHIEDRSIDIVSPTAAEMLDLAQTFEATTNVDFKSADQLGSGQRQLRYEETVQAKAGQTGEITIPTEFHIGVQPFEGGEAYRLKARFRYRITNGKLLLGYKFERPEDVLREAFTDRMVATAEATGQTVLRGTPPPARS